MAGLVLLVMGVLLGLPAVFVLLIAVGGALRASQASSDVVGPGDAVFAILIVAVAVLLPAVAHILAAIGVFAHKRWARWTGIALSVIGVSVGVLLLLTQVQVGRVNVLVFVVVLAYGFTAAVLTIRAKHFSQPAQL